MMIMMNERKNIEVNTWYNCKIGDDLELCKIVRRYKDMGNNRSICSWTVVTYYTATYLYSSSLGVCKRFIKERYIYG